MKQCECRSMAINKDPEKVKCDVCYAYQQGQSSSAARIAELEVQVSELEGLAEYQCADCQDTGWLENRVEGKYACTCMTEMEPYQLLESRIAELESDARIMSESLLKTHKAANCGNNKAMDYIRHGAVIKVCPACIIAAKYREG